MCVLYIRFSTVSAPKRLQPCCFFCLEKILLFIIVYSFNAWEEVILCVIVCDCFVIIPFCTIVCSSFTDTSTRKIAQKNVSIDLSTNLDLRVTSRPKPMMELPAPKREKSLSFRLPTAGTASATLIEEPAEEEKQQAQVSLLCFGFALSLPTSTMHIEEPTEEEKQQAQVSHTFGCFKLCLSLRRACRGRKIAGGG